MSDDGPKLVRRVVGANVGAFLEAVMIAADMYTPGELAFWLNAPQPLLDMWTPVQLLAREEAAHLLVVLHQVEDGNFA